MTAAQRLMSTLVLTFALTLTSALALPHPALAQEQRFSRNLEDVKLYGQGEEVEFLFSQPYQGTPFVETRPGQFTLSFNGTGSSHPVRTLRPKDQSPFQEIRVVENRYSTSVSFQLRDATLNLKDHLKFSGSGTLLRMQIALPSRVAAATPALAVSTPPQKAGTKADDDVGQLLLEEMEKRIGGSNNATAANGTSAAATDATAPPGTGLNTTDFFVPVLTMVLALIIIVGGLYGVLYLYNRYFASRLSKFAGGQPIRQLASFHIGPRQRVVVLEIKGEIIACGVTPQQISYLTHLSGKQRPPRSGSKPGANLQGDSSAPPSSGNPGVSPGGSRASSDVAVDAVKADPMHQFAEVLKEKVKSLKRIN